MFICLFTKLQQQKRIFVLRNSAVKPQHLLFENESFLPKMPENFCAKKYRFFALIVVYTLEKIPWKNFVKFWKWNLKRTHQLVKNSCLRKSNITFCIIFNMISFVNTQGSVKIRLACSKALLVTISSSNIVTHSNGYKGGDEFSLFIKVGAGNVLLKLNFLQSRVETQYRKILFITPSNIKHFIERQSVAY